MHDVLAHRISQISLHAGALGFRDDLTAEEMRVSAAVIQEKATRRSPTCAGCSAFCGTDDRRALDAPQPTYADLPRLVEEARAAGVHVEYEDLIDRRRSAGAGRGGAHGLPDRAGGHHQRPQARPGAAGDASRSAARPRTASTSCCATRSASAQPTPGAGLGLIGLAERAELRGGWLEHRRDGSTFVLHGWIPWAA